MTTIIQSPIVIKAMDWVLDGAKGMRCYWNESSNVWIYENGESVGGYNNGP